jgi:anti-sigma regulatory factor (Ser/Thr protein kinase)
MKEILNLRLVGGPHAPARARHAIQSLERSLDDRAEDVSLLVSELVTNAVLHSGAGPDDPIEVAASAGSETIHVAVADPGGGFDPENARSEREIGGYGLRLVETLANRWGVSRKPRPCVWFEIDCEGPRPA